MNIDFWDLAIKIIALLIAIIGHEIAHGVAALKFGDTTAKDYNRLSPNPIVHIDPLGSVILPLLLFFINAPFLFGWAKPVPVNINRVIQNGGYNGAILVSLAGILYNFALALLVVLLIKMGLLGDSPNSLVLVFASYLIFINIILGVFNLFPIPPLDGAQALGYLSLKFGFEAIPRFFNKIEPYGIFIMFGILFLAPAIIATPINYILRLF